MLAKTLNRLIFQNNLWILRQLLFWSFIYLDELLSLVGLTSEFEDYQDTLITFAFDLVVVYTIIYVLVPYLLRKKNYLLFILGCTVLLTIITFFSLYWGEFFQDDEVDHLAAFITAFVLFASVAGLAFGIKIYKINYLDNRKLEELRISNANTELAFLKNQINPHFLFNALNSLHVMSKKKDDQLPDSILNLSDLLRYHLYDSDRNYIPLLKEVKFLAQYIQFEQMRRSNLEVESSFEVNNVSAEIEPLLLLPMVENAFKYCQRSDDQTALISIKLYDEGDTIYFSMNNSKGNLQEKPKGPYSGIGLKNVRRRLELSYPNKHKIDIFESEDKFELTLELKN